MVIRRASGSVVDTRAGPCRPAFLRRAATAGSCAKARATRCCRSVAARWRAAATRRVLASGSSCTSRFNASTCAVASATACVSRAPRRNEPAPALARTFTPSCATRGRSTKPSAIRAATLRRQQLVEVRAGLHPKVGQRVIAHRHAPPHPPVRVVLLAQPRHRPCATDPLQGRVQPQGHENRGVNRRAAGVSLDGLDHGVQRPELQAFHEVPHHAGAMLGRQQAVQVRRA